MGMLKLATTEVVRNATPRRSNTSEFKEVMWNILWWKLVPKKKYL